MDRDALIPVLLVSLGVILLTSAVVGTLSEGTDIPELYLDAVENAGLALVLVAVLVLLEWISFAKYREKGRLRPAVDGALVFIAAFLVTFVAAFTAVVLGLEGVSVDLGAFSADTVGFVSGVAGLIAGAYTFYARNRDCYTPPGERRAES